MWAHHYGYNVLCSSSFPFPARSVPPGAWSTKLDGQSACHEEDEVTNTTFDPSSSSNIVIAAKVTFANIVISLAGNQTSKRPFDKVALSTVSAFRRWLQIILMLLIGKCKSRCYYSARKFASEGADQRDPRIKDTLPLINLSIVHGRIIAVFD